MGIARHKTRQRELREARGLVGRAQRGDSRAFELLYAAYEGRVYRFCHRLTGRDETAAALLELTFARAFASLPEQGLETLDVPAYLYATARTLAFERNGEPLGSRGAAESEVHVANERLPAQERALLALRDLEGRPDAEIARALAVEEAQVAELVGAARLHLLAELRPPGSGGPCRGRLGGLSAYADELLAPERRAELEQHVPGCADCRATLFALREAALRYRTLAVPEPPGELGSRIATALGLVGLPPRKVASETLAAGGRQTAAAVAMGVLAIIGIGATIAASRSDDGDKPVRAPSPAAPSPEAQPSAPASGAALAAGVAAVVGASPTHLRPPPALRHVRGGARRVVQRHAPPRRSIPPGLGRSFAPEAPPSAPPAPPAAAPKTAVTTHRPPTQERRIPVEIVPPPVTPPQAEAASSPPEPPPAPAPPPPSQATTA